MEKGKDLEIKDKEVWEREHVDRPMGVDLK